MAELKTKQSDEDVNGFLDTVADEKKRKDCQIISELMREITGESAKMWGTSIVGFGKYHYKYASGQEGDWMLTGFSPRKQNISLYLMAGYVMLENPEFENILKDLGKYKLGKGCLYINKLEDIKINRLKELIVISVEFLRGKYPNI
jgi:hypothetical protein